MSDHSKGQPKDISLMGQPTNKDVVETHVSQKKRSGSSKKHDKKSTNDPSSKPLLSPY